MDSVTLNAILACPACRFDDSTVAQAASFAIGFMVLVVFGVLAGFVALIVKLARGERLALMEEQQANAKSR